ncbi:MAG: tripartite tricarboxylate transporter TctB family protein [Actinobacteria bacterium]|nr:tripartite tricarboxylate transporter TctB family protein [Actinomycetota bacterium]
MNVKRLAALVNVDNAFLVAVGALAASFLVGSFRLNAMAAAFPKLVSAIALILVVYVLVGRIVAVLREATAVPARTRDEPAEPHDRAQSGRTIPWFLMFVFTLLYPLVVLFAGFPSSTLVFVTGVAMLLGLRGIRGLLFGALSTAVLVLLFQYVLQVPLPGGLVWEVLFRS